MKLHDFSEVYGIKESALRYWEKAGILSAKRMENQKYRDLSTNISRLLYLDILYYRKNGVAVKDMTDFDKMDEEQIYEMLEKTETKLDEQLALLNRQRDNLRQRQCMIKFLRDFGKKPYRLVKLPDLEACLCDLLAVDGIGILNDLDLLGCDLSDDSYSKAWAWEWLTEYQVLWDSKLKAGLANLVLEEKTEWLHDLLEIYIVRKSAYVVVGLDDC